MLIKWQLSIVRLVWFMNQVQRINYRIESQIIFELVQFVANPILYLWTDRWWWNEVDNSRIYRNLNLGLRWWAEKKRRRGRRKWEPKTCSAPSTAIILISIQHHLQSQGHKMWQHTTGDGCNQLLEYDFVKGSYIRYLHVKQCFFTAMWD
jgi:hypothetical protein